MTELAQPTSVGGTQFIENAIVSVTSTKTITEIVLVTPSTSALPNSIGDLVSTPTQTWLHQLSKTSVVSPSAIHTEALTLVGKPISQSTAIPAGSLSSSRPSSTASMLQTNTSHSFPSSTASSTLSPNTSSPASETMENMAEPTSSGLNHSSAPGQGGGRMGAIVGGVLGTMIAFLILAITVIVLCRHRRRSRTNHVLIDTEKADCSIDPLSPKISQADSNNSLPYDNGEGRLRSPSSIRAQHGSMIPRVR